MDVQQVDTSTVAENRKFLSIVNDKGRVTIPIEVRKFMKVKPNTHITFHMRAGSVHISPQPMSLEDTFGSIKPLQAGKDLEEVIHEAKEAHYEQRFRKTMT